MSTQTLPSRVAVVIVNYRTPSLTIDCLRSLEPERAALGDRLSVIVTDNSSPDDSVNLLRAAITQNNWSDWITLLPLPKNGGFAYGNNAAIRNLLSSPTPPDYIHLLNPDTLLHPRAISELLTFMDSHPRAGIVGSRLENPDGSPQPSACRFHSLLSEIENGFRLGPISALLKNHIVSPPPPETPAQTDWVSGASFLIRTQTIHDIGLLDEQFFMYYEETDFCLRASRAGHECWYLPTSRVTHLQGQSTAGAKRLPPYYFHSRKHYFQKHHSRLYTTLATLLHALTYTTWRLRRPLQRKPDNDPPHYLSDLLHHTFFPHPQSPPSSPFSRSPLGCASPRTTIGIIIIGRNEGDRLVKCLHSVKNRADAIIYVDSGSSDNSLANARNLGATAIELDLTRPFTAARARHAGVQQLLTTHPHIDYLQFIDGDCELSPTWLDTAANTLSSDPKLAVVCGRLHEKHPEASLYNRLCDIEWNRPAGPANECGGIAMMRASAYTQVGGFNPDLIANEEPELCLRLRQSGWSILRLPDDMGSHDADMTRFSQWWRRSARPGYSNSELLAMHGPREGAEYAHQIRSVRIWTLLIPILTLALLYPTHGWSLLLLTLYPLQAFRIFLRHYRRLGFRDSSLYSLACVACKFPQLTGQLRYHRLRSRSERSSLIEYKSPASTSPSIAYLINCYPSPTQSFIRREIAALEQSGLTIQRYTVRRWKGSLPDPTDRAEQNRTQCILSANPLTLLFSTLTCLFTRPLSFLSALRLTYQVARRADRGYLAHAAYLIEACVLSRWTRRANIRHVHAHFATNSTTVAMLCHAVGGPPYSFTVHGPEDFWRASYLSLPQKLRHARFAATISEFARSQLYFHCDPADWHKVNLVRCTVDDRFLTPSDTPFPTSPKILSVGRLAPEKGHLILLQSCARLLSAGIPFSLEIIGDGPLRPTIESEIARLHLSPHVTLTGWQSGDYVRSALLSSRALIQPSFAEGLPVVIMEALALARPVIATYLAGIPELVHPNINGWLVPAGSVDALTTSLKDLLTSDPTRLSEMGRHGSNLVSEHHCARTEAAKLRRLFSQSLSTSNLQPLPQLTPLESL